MGPLGHSLAALAAVGGLPVGLAGLVLRPGWRVGLSERLGARPSATPGAIWVHGASVGEIQLATRLLDQLLESGETVVASSMTVTGRDLLRDTRPGIPCALAPLDHPWCVEAALGRVRPSALVFVETELWPSWILAARRRGIPVIIASARISDRSRPRYRRIARLLGPVLRSVSAVGARSATDAERFIELGVPSERVSVTGDLKLEPSRVAPVLAPELAAILGGTPLIVAGSTHEGEEQAALGALAGAEAAGLRAALVLAPRHPSRFEAVANLVEAAGRPLRRRSRLASEDPLAPGEVLLLDSLGELTALFARADVVFVGGSLVSRGGHNPLEPVMSGRAVLFGPHMENAREAAALLLSVGAARRVNGPEELTAAVVEALKDPAGWSSRGARGAAELECHRGAAKRTAALVRQVRADARAGGLGGPGKGPVPGPDRNPPGPDRNPPGPDLKPPGPDRNPPGPDRKPPGPDRNPPGPNLKPAGR